MAQCKKCGQEIPDGTDLCNECKKQLSADNTAQAKRNKKYNIAISCLVAFMIVLVIALVVVIIFYPSDTTPDESASANTSSSDLVDSNLLTVDVTIPASFFTDENPPTAELTEEQKNSGYISATVNADGSVTYKIKKSEWNKIVNDMKAEAAESLDKIASESNFASIKKVEYNDNFSKIKFYVNAQEYKNNLDSMAAMQAYFATVFYQEFTNQTPGAEYTIIDIDSNAVIETFNYPDKTQNAN